MLQANISSQGYLYKVFIKFAIRPKAKSELNAAAQKTVYTTKFQSIEDWIDCFKQLAANYDTAIIEKVTKSVLNPTKHCLKSSGGYVILLPSASS